MTELQALVQDFFFQAAEKGKRSHSSEADKDPGPRSALRGSLPDLAHLSHLRLTVIMMKGFKHPAGGPRGGHEFPENDRPRRLLSCTGTRDRGFRGEILWIPSPNSAGPIEFPVVARLPEQSDLMPDLGLGDSGGLQLGQIRRVKIRRSGFFFLLEGSIAILCNVAKKVG